MMDTKQCIFSMLKFADIATTRQLLALDEQALALRPHADCLTIRRQWGHLVLSEHQYVSRIRLLLRRPVHWQLPRGFEEAFEKDGGTDCAAHWASEIAMIQRQNRSHTLDALTHCSAANLDVKTGVSYAPSVGATFSAIASHWLMHLGQWHVVLTRLGKLPEEHPVTLCSSICVQASDTKHPAE